MTSSSATMNNLGSVGTMFIKKNMLIAILIGLLVLAFTHLGSSHRTYDDPNTGAPETETFSYMKVFIGTVFAVYILLYLINSSSQSDATLLNNNTTAAQDAKILAHSVDAVLKNIDLGDPKF